MHPELAAGVQARTRTLARVDLARDRATAAEDAEGDAARMSADGLGLLVTAAKYT